MKFLKLTIIFAVLLTCASMYAQTSKTRLWSKADGKGSNHAELWRFAPDSAQNGNSKAVIICPGGSYHHLGLKNEGVKAARWFCSKGYDAYVLRYRVAMNGFHHPAMLEDFERAVEMVNADSIGAIGFSAGGHLVLMAGAFLPKEKRPAWVAAIYPVVSMQDSIAHPWSRKSLLGRHYTQEAKDKFSMELQIPDDMPPVYLQVSDDDHTVNPQNSIALSKVLEQKGVTYTFSHFNNGGHGYGFGNNAFNSTSHWYDTLYQWLQTVCK